MSHLSCLTSLVPSLLPHLSCLNSPVSTLIPISPVPPLLSHLFCLTSPIPRLLSHVSSLSSPVPPLLSHVSCLISSFSPLLSHLSCLTSPVSYILSLFSDLSSPHQKVHKHAQISPLHITTPRVLPRALPLVMLRTSKHKKIPIFHTYSHIELGTSVIIRATRYRANDAKANTVYETDARQN